MLTEQKPESTGRSMYIENRIFNNENYIILRSCHPELVEGQRIK